jgi:hypothetical protein
MIIAQWNDISKKPAASIITAVMVEVSVPLKHWYKPTKPHSITSQETIIILTY